MLRHSILIAELKFIGFEESAIYLLSEYLKNSSQKVLLNGSYSIHLTLSKEVPQGSILGPLLYIIYTANFFSAIQYCNFHLYADGKIRFIGKGSVNHQGLRDRAPP